MCCHRFSHKALTQRKESLSHAVAGPINTRSPLSEVQRLSTVLICPIIRGHLPLPGGGKGEGGGVIRAGNELEKFQVQRPLVNTFNNGP